MIKIVIDKKLISVNHLYGRHGYRSYLKPEGKILREYIINLIDKQKIEIDKYIDKELKIEVKVYKNWYTKKGIIARADISNLEKFLVDSVFMALKSDTNQLDDKQIFKHTMIKKQSNIEKSVIKIDIL